jgi:hypothetical protein
MTSLILFNIIEQCFGKEIRIEKVVDKMQSEADGR